MLISTTNLKILSPSPTNCIVQITDSNGQVRSLIGSAEHCYTTNNLYKSKLPHSYKIGNANVYAMFDISRTPIGVDVSMSKITAAEQPNYLLLPHYHDNQTSNALSGVNSNKNAFIGSIHDSTNTFAHREYKSGSKYFEYVTSPDTITLYSKANSATTISATTRLKNLIKLADNSKKFTRLFTLQTFNPATNTLNTPITNSLWQANCIDFDYGVLSATSFVTPKQTLNAQYTTENDNKQYQITRCYTPDKMYSSGNNVVLNYIENRRISANTQTISPILVQNDLNEELSLSDTDIANSTLSTYQITSYDVAYTSYQRFKMYQPEFLQSADDSYSGNADSHATDDYITEQHAIHKSTLYSVDLTETYISDVITAVVGEVENQNYNNFKSTLHATINNRLQALVKTIAPVHTQLFNVKI